MPDITKDWCLNMAALEGDAEIGAGVTADPHDGTLFEKLEAARAMLAALKKAEPVVVWRNGVDSATAKDIAAAITQAEAAGIRAEG